MQKTTRRLLQIIKKYTLMKGVYLETYKLLTEIRDEVQSHTYTLTDMTNMLYVLREISKFADDLRKEIDGIASILEKVICALYIVKNLDDPIRASLVTGSPTIRQGVKLPKQSKDPDKYNELMAHFGISHDVAESNLVRPHWPGVCQYATTLAEEGKPLPPGINPEDTYSVYSVRLTIIKNLDELIHSLEQVNEATLKQVKRKEEKACEELLTTR